MGAYGARSGKIQDDEPGAPFSPKKYTRGFSKRTVACPKHTGANREGSQSWSNLSNNINNKVLGGKALDYTSQNKINIHEAILIHIND